MKLADKSKQQNKVQLYPVLYCLDVDKQLLQLSGNNVMEHVWKQMRTACQISLGSSI